MNSSGESRPPHQDPIQHSPGHTEFSRQAVIDSMTEGLNIADLNGNLLLVNRRGAELLGFTSPEEYRKALPEFIGTFELFSSEGALLPYEQWPLNRLLHGEPVRDYVVTVHRIGTDRFITLSHNGSITCDAKGEPLYAVLTYRDVTEQVKAREALRRKEEELREAQRIARVGNWYWDVHSDKVTVSDEVFELYGLDPNKPYPSLKEQEGTLLPSRSWGLVGAAIARTVRTGEPYELEFEVNHGKGGTIWITARGEAVRNAHGEMIGMRGTVQDITERKRAETRIAFLASFPELNPNPVLEVNARGIVSYANKAALTILKNSGGSQDVTLFLPRDLELLLQALGQEEGPGSYYREVKIGDHTIGENIYLFRDLGVVRMYARDVTEQKAAEDALRRQAQLIDLSPDAILVREVDGTIRFWSKGAEALYGWTSEEAVGQASHELLRTESATPLHEIIAETLRVGRWSGELTHTTKDNQRVIVQSRWMIQCDAEGGVGGILESNLDVTEAKTAELALRESEERFRTMADSTPVMIWVTNASGEIEFVNHAYEKFFGVTEAQAKSPATWTMLIHPEDKDRYAAAYAKALKLHAPFDADARVMHHSGEWHWVHSFGAPRFSGDGRFLGHVGSSPDITEQKRAADALKASLENLRLMVSNASEAMMVIDSEGRIEASSSLASRLLGYEEGELVGKRINQFAETFSRLEASLTLDNLRKGAPRPMTSSLRIKTKDGTMQWMSVTGNIVDLGVQGEKYFVKVQKLDLPASRSMRSGEKK